ncbi:spectrin beta chain, non-erythrocytic 2 [Patagioenas fasciata]|uniref:spectrin beta chain, non-erythrocytic 2 n=1 Tax=Patagioenas fasciata TaxID=372321 RepID=UPI003A9A22FA
MLSPPPYEALDLPRPLGDGRWAGGGAEEEEEEEEGGGDEGSSARRFERSRIRALADEREAVQKKTFTKWVNSHLAGGPWRLGDLYSDLRDGRLLLRLLEELSGETLPKPSKGRMRIHCLENVEQALRFLREQRVHLENVGSHDIVDGNPRLTLGLLWTIILRFQIQDISVESEDSKERKSAKDALLLWCQMKTAGYPGVHVQNFSTSWRDGRAFNAVIHRHRPELVPAPWGSSAQQRLLNAFSVAEKELGLAPLLDPEDVCVEQPDERSVLTYVSALYHRLSSMSATERNRRRLGKVLDAALEAEQLVGRYEEQAAELLGWIQRTVLALTDPRLPAALPALQGQLQAFSSYRTTEKPPRFTAKGALEVLLFSLQSRMRSNNQRVWVPGDGRLLADINRAWAGLERAEHARELALRTELIRQEQLEQLAQRFHRKAQMRESWLGDNRRLLAQAPFGADPPAAEAALRRHEALRADVEAYGGRVAALAAAAAALEAGRYHGAGRALARRERVRRLWEELRRLLAARRPRLLRHVRLQEVLGDARHLAAWMEHMEGRLAQRPPEGEAQLQLQVLLEADISAQAERVRAVRDAAVALGADTGDSPPCDPSALERAAALERRFTELEALAAERRARLEESQRLWQFRWDLGQEEAWMGEQERLLRAGSAATASRDLPGALRLLSQHRALQSQLGNRAAALERALERGRELAAQGGAGAAEAAALVRDVERRWRSLVELAAERCRSIQEAAGALQFQAEAAEVAARLEDTRRLAAGAGVGRDEHAARSLARRHRGVRDELRGHRAAIDALRRQATALPPGGDGDPGASARVEELERRYREVEEVAERRSRELEEALRFHAMRGEADACALWLGEKERWLLAVAVPERMEDLEVLQQRFETLEPEMKQLASRVGAVNRAAEELLGAGSNREGARAARQQLNERWERFRALAEQKKAALGSALALQNFQLECDETAAWMRGKTDAIAATRGLGSDPHGVAALRRKLSAVRRDLDAIQAKLRDLRAEGEKLVARHPAEASAVPARLSALEGVWDELRGALRRHEEALEAAGKVQGVLRDLAALQGWVAQTAGAVATEDAPATLAEAERLLRQHEALGEEMERYGAEYRGVRDAGREAARGQTDAVLRQRVEALDAGWEELGRMWETRRRRLRQALAFQMFLRDAKQLEGVIGTQEYALAHADVPGTVPGAEAAVKKLEDVVGAVEVAGERLQVLVAAREKLVAEGNPRGEEAREAVVALERRHHGNREAAQELLERLRDNLELQRFLQKAEELALWMEEKLRAAQDGAHGDARSLRRKCQRHQAFAAELAANRGWLDSLEEEARALSASRPALCVPVRARAAALAPRWAALEAATRGTARRLRDALSAELCAQGCAALRRALDAMHHQLRRSHAGHDLGSVSRLIGKHQVLEKQAQEREEELAALSAQAEALGPELRAQVAALEQQLRALREPLRERGRLLIASRRQHRLRRDLEDEILWVQERRPLAESTDLGKDLPSVQLLIKKNETLQKELQGHERRVEDLLAHDTATDAAAAGARLRAAWRELRLQAERRHRRLLLALAAHQFYRDAAEAEAWMGERELRMLAQDKAEDEPGAQAALSKHLVLEQELRDYAHTVRQLAAQSGDMAERGHPESERLRARQAQVERQWAALAALAGERRRALQQHQRLCQLKRDLDDLARWIAQREAVAAAQDLGQDYEHVTLLRARFREFSLATSGLGQERVDGLNAQAAALVAAGHPEGAAVAEWQDGLNEAWADLLELMDTRAQALAAAHELQRFLAGARQALERLRHREQRLPEELGRDLSAAEALERGHRADESDVEALGAQVRQVQEDAARLAQAYAGEQAAEIRRHEQAVAEAWERLRGSCQSRRRRLLDTVDTFRFLRAARDLLLWTDGVRLQMEGRERPRDVSGADLAIKKHQSVKAELEARADCFDACVAAGTALLGRGHHAAEKISEQLSQLQERRRDLWACWQHKMDWLQIVLEVLVFARDAGAAEAWLSRREPLLRSGELGRSVAEAERLLQRHRGFQRALGAWEQRFAALERLTTLEERERRRRQGEEEEEEEEEEGAARKRRKIPTPPPAQPQPGGGPPALPPPSQDGGDSGDTLRTPQSGPREPPAINGLDSAQVTPALTKGAQQGAPGAGGSPRGGAPPPDPAHAATLPPPRGPPESLEGALCRKHEMEAQGKKASNRSWHSVYCVLRGGSLSFHKDARAAGGGVPFHGEPPAPLPGARAHPATHYRKRKHVFRLGLSDGKEYLFQAKDEAEMSTWLRVIQAAAAAPVPPFPGGGGTPGRGGKGVTRARSLPPAPPPPAGPRGPRDKDRDRDRDRDKDKDKDKDKRFSFFKKNK